MAKFYEEEEEFNIWPTYSDVGFSIVLILAFIVLAQYVVVGKILQINKITEEQKVLSDSLRQAFPVEYGATIKDSAQPQFQKITFSDRILFDSGSDILKTEGQEVLRRVAEILRALRARRVFDEIQIRGHTDDVPIANTALKTKFPTNWELSSARATSVVRFFVEQCGLTSSRELLLSAQGFSEYDYIRENRNEATRALNRRIEIVIKYPLAY